MNNRTEIEIKAAAQRITNARRALRDWGGRIGLTAVRDATFWNSPEIEANAREYLKAAREYRCAIEGAQELQGRLVQS